PGRSARARSDQSSLPPLNSPSLRLASGGPAYSMADALRLALPLLKNEPAGAGRVGERLHPSVVFVAAAIEHHPLDPAALGLLREERADHLRRGDVPAGSLLGPERLAPLALGRVGFAQHAELRGGLPQQRLVRAAQRDQRLLVDLRRDALREREDHRMRVTERELDHAPLDLATVADADDLELPLEGRLHARHHVLDQRPREAVEGADLTVLVRARDDDLVAIDLRAEPRRQGLHQPALGAL